MRRYRRSVSRPFVGAGLGRVVAGRHFDGDRFAAYHDTQTLAGWITGGGRAIVVEVKAG